MRFGALVFHRHGPMGTRSAWAYSCRNTEIVKSAKPPHFLLCWVPVLAVRSRVDTHAPFGDVAGGHLPVV